MIRILVADDHAVVREGIKQILAGLDDMIVEDEAESGQDVLSKIASKKYDLILLDISMPGKSGLEVLEDIKIVQPRLPVLILSMHPEEQYAVRMLRAGAAGYLTKGAGPDEMIQAIRLVHSGQRYISPEIAQQMALSQFASADENPFKSLSERELQIMMMITKGQKVTDISEQLNLSPKTVNSYRYRLFSKLGINGDVELTHLAIRYGMLDADTL